MSRCFLPGLEGESSARYVLRAWRLVLRLAPVAVLRGRRIAFVTKAMSAPIIAALLTSKGLAARAYATNGMTPEERETSLCEWRADSSILLVASSTFATGINELGITLVVHFGLPQDPLEHFQEDGRIRGAGLSVTFVRVRYLIERALLPAPLERASVALDMAVQLVKILTHAGCLRCALVGWLGGSVTACSGCDCCVLDGTLAAREASSEAAAVACGSFPYFMGLRPARNAAIEVLHKLELDGEQLLTTLLQTPPEEAPSPQHHEAVVLTLIGRRAIHVRLRETKSGVGLLLLASASPGALSEFQSCRKNFDVWLWKPAAAPCAAVTAEELAEARQLLAMHDQAMRDHRAARRRLVTDMLSRGATMGELGLDEHAAIDLTTSASPSVPTAPLPSPKPAPKEPALPLVQSRLPPSPQFRIHQPKASSKRTPSKITASPELTQPGGSETRETIGAIPFSLGSEADSPGRCLQRDRDAESPGRRLVSQAKRLLSGAMSDLVGP